MDNYEYDNLTDEVQEDVQPDYFQTQQYPVQPEYVQYTPQTLITPVYNPPRKKKRKKDMDAVVIIGLLIAVVIAVFFAVKSARKGESVFDIDMSSVINEQLSTSAALQQSQSTPVQTTVQPSAEQSTTEATMAATAVQESSGDISETAPVTESTTPADGVQPADAEILKAVSDAINSLKDPSASFKGTKTQKLHIQLTECSVPALVDPANKVLEYFAGEEVFEFDFTNGKATDPETGEEISSATAIPPTDKAFTLTSEGVAKYEYEQAGDKKIYRITLVSESSNLASPRPPHHDAACDVLDFSAFELPMGEITKADIDYPGAVISVTVDAEGKVVEYHENLSTKGVGEGKLVITGSGSMEGYIDEKWTIEWK